MNFKIVDTKQMDKNTLKGTFALMAGPLKISDFTYHEKDGKSWIGFPAKEYFDKEGEKKYWPIIRIEDDDRYRAFQKWAKEQVKDIFAQPEPANEEPDIPF
jgi:hypothetical protein